MDWVRSDSMTLLDINSWLNIPNINQTNILKYLFMKILEFVYRRISGESKGASLDAYNVYI